MWATGLVLLMISTGWADGHRRPPCLDGYPRVYANRERPLYAAPKGEPPNLTAVFEEIKDLPAFPFERAGGHWIKTSDGSYLHAWFEPALLPNGSLKMSSSPTVVISTGLSGRARDTYLSGYVDTLRRQGLNVAFVEGNGDGWTELYARYEAHHGRKLLSDRFPYEQQGMNLVEAVEGLDLVPRAKNILQGPTQYYHVGNSYGAWVGQAAAAGPRNNFFRRTFLLGPGTESLHRSFPGVREFEDFLDCFADRVHCPPGAMALATDWLAQWAELARKNNQVLMEGMMDAKLADFLRQHFPIFGDDPIRLESAIRKFKGIWMFDTKKVAPQMRSVTLITARHDSVMPARQGVIVHDELGAALKNSPDYGGHIEIADADHDFLSTGLQDPMYNQSAVLIAHLIKGTGPAPALQAAQGQKMIIDSLKDVTQIRPARIDEIHDRRSTVVTAPVDQMVYRFNAMMDALELSRERWINLFRWGH